MHTPTRGAENQTFKRELEEEVEKAGRKRKADADEDDVEEEKEVEKKPRQKVRKDDKIDKVGHSGSKKEHERLLCPTNGSQDPIEPIKKKVGKKSSPNKTIGTNQQTWKKF